MNIQWTAASERVIAEARNWCLGDSDTCVEAPAVLIGLLSEQECRAAILLGCHDIQAATVQDRWPALQRRDTPGNEDTSLSNKYESRSEPLVLRFSAEIQSAVAVAKDLLADLPQPLSIATEHLLLGLVASEEEVGDWLRQCGLNVSALRDEILGQYGLASFLMEIGDEEPLVAGGEDEVSQDRSEPEEASLSCTADTVRAMEEQFQDTNVCRLLDASANRAREALRVVEDYVRFFLDDRHLTERLKTMRHDLTSVLRCLAMSDRLAMRDTQADVGTTITTPAELVRRDPREVLTANFTRLQESLRSLEEFGKIGGFASGQVERLRYEAYTLHKAVHGTLEALGRLGEAKLYVLVDGRSSVDSFERLVSELIDSGVDVIQLRDKTLGDRELLDRARRLRELTAGSATLFVMNDRPDLAVLSGADGVHVGQEELTVRDVRQIVGPQMLIGVSTHGIEQARQAVLDGASYLGVGPVFPSGTKDFADFPGLEYARSVAAEIRLPAFAIGGIDGGNIDKVLATGIGRVAVSGAVASAADPAGAVRGLVAHLASSPESVGEFWFG